MDLIGWSYVLLGDKKGYAAIFTAIDIIENRIGKELNKEAPKGMSQEEYEQYLFLKARAYRHLGSTYYTFKDIDVGHYCNEALKVLEVLKSNGFDKSKNQCTKTCFTASKTIFTCTICISLFRTTKEKTVTATRANWTRPAVTSKKR